MAGAPLKALKNWAQRELDAIEAARQVVPLLDFVPQTTPKWRSPVWLSAYASVLSRAAGGSVRTVVAAPPQHGKTELSIHAFAWWLKQRPELRSAYATYAQARSDRVARKARGVCVRAGVQVSGPTRSWTTPGGGSVIWTSIGGPLTGEPVDGILLVDDPYKDRQHAESPAYAEQVLDWLDDVAETRVHPGASIIVMATRWAPRDLSGILVKRGWDYVNIKAICDGEGRPEGDNREVGEALCPDRKPIEELLRLQKVNPFSFASLYQGQPRPRGGALLGSATYYSRSDLPKTGFQIGHGTDMSYSAKTSSDWSVCVRFLRVRTGEKDERGRMKYRYYLLKVDRAQVKSPQWGDLLKGRINEPGYRSSVYWRASGTEDGTADLMRAKGVRMVTFKPTADKYTHAQPFAEAWNDGRVLVPDSGEEWVQVYVDELEAFIGKDGQQDDQVDASVGCFDGMEMFGSVGFSQDHDDSLPKSRV